LPVAVSEMPTRAGASKRKSKREGQGEGRIAEMVAVEPPGPAVVTEDDIAATAAEAAYDSVMVDGEVVSCVHTTAPRDPSQPGADAADIYIEVDLAAGAVSSDSVPGCRTGTSSAPLSGGYVTIGAVLRSRYVMSQLFFNMLGSFCGPLLSFGLLFGVNR